MVPPAKDGELLEFLVDEKAVESISGPAWRILVVDNEPEVHQTTVLALNGVVVEGRPLELLHAYSAAEARAILGEHGDVAIVMLDVVMETPDAGLRLVEHIRDERGDRTVRIILRTGQPGCAPEIDTIRGYDINDYLTKAELTRTRLITSVTFGIRSYWQTHQSEASRRGLEMIVSASAELSQPMGLHRLAEGVAAQLAALLEVGEDGIVCAAEADFDNPARIIAGTGRCSEWIGRPLAEIAQSRVREEIERCQAERAHRLGEIVCLFFCVTDSRSVMIFIDAGHPLGELDRKLLEVFCGNIVVAFENAGLYQRINDLAFEDELVGLANRNGFLALIARRQAAADVVALVNLDGFSDINSALDQDFGDSILRAAARRMREMFPASVDLGRIGADSFVLLGPEDQVNPENIANVFATPFAVGEEQLRLSATTGLVRIADTAPDGAELLKQAGAALKQAKAAERGKALYFEPELAEAARSRMHMLSRLRLAFAEERLFPVYQPFIDLASGRVVGAECLLRWRTAEGEFIPPDRFIPFAEKSGLMVPIGQWVMRTAFQFLGRLIALGHDDFRMAVNVSYAQFREPDFVDTLVSLLQACRVPAANVEVELTESLAIDRIDTIVDKLAVLRAAGVSTALDDFGTGYSSLSLLCKLNVDRLKIDRSFVSGDGNPDDRLQIAAIVLQLARLLGIRTIAEGIETEAQRKRLLQLGCGEGQGYLFSKPLPADQFLAYLQKGAA